MSSKEANLRRLRRKAKKGDIQAMFDIADLSDDPEEKRHYLDLVGESDEQIAFALRFIQAVGRENYLEE